MREELRQIFQTGVKNKHGNGIHDSRPLLSAERGSSPPGSLESRQLASACDGALVAVTRLRLIVGWVNAPTCLCLFFFSPFFLYIE